MCPNFLERTTNVEIYGSYCWASAWQGLEHSYKRATIEAGRPYRMKSEKIKSPKMKKNAK